MNHIRPITPDVNAAFWRVIPIDADPIETREWLDVFATLVQGEGRERGTYDGFGRSDTRAALRRFFETAGRQRRRYGLSVEASAPWRL